MGIGHVAAWLFSTLFLWRNVPNAHKAFGTGDVKLKTAVIAWSIFMEVYMTGKTFGNHDDSGVSPVQRVLYERDLEFFLMKFKDEVIMPALTDIKVSIAVLQERQNGYEDRFRTIERQIAERPTRDEVQIIVDKAGDKVRFDLHREIGQLRSEMLTKSDVAEIVKTALENDKRLTCAIQSNRIAVGAFIAAVVVPVMLKFL
jgi:hypothetical protein